MLETPGGITPPSLGLAPSVLLLDEEVSSSRHLRLSKSVSIHAHVRAATCVQRLSCNAKQKTPELFGPGVFWWSLV